MAIGYGAPVVVRIKGASSEGKDWTVPRDVNFRRMLVRIR